MMTIVISFDFLFVKITVYETSARKRSQQDFDNAELSLTPTGTHHSIFHPSLYIHFAFRFSIHEVCWLLETT